MYGLRCSSSRQCPRARSLGIETQEWKRRERDIFSAASSASQFYRESCAMGVVSDTPHEFFCRNLKRKLRARVRRQHRNVLRRQRQAKGLVGHCFEKCIVSSVLNETEFWIDVGLPDGIWENEDTSLWRRNGGGGELIVDIHTPREDIFETTLLDLDHDLLHQLLWHQLRRDRQRAKTARQSEGIQRRKLVEIELSL